MFKLLHPLSLQAKTIPATRTLEQTIAGNVAEILKA